MQQIMQRQDVLIWLSGVLLYSHQAGKRLSRPVCWNRATISEAQVQ